MSEIVTFFESILGADWMIFVGAGIVVIALLFLALFFVLQKKRKISSKDKQQIFDQITIITRQKAELQADLLALKEATKYGTLTKRDYDKRFIKEDNEIKKLDNELDKLIDEIAKDFFAFAYKKEVMADQEKINYLVKLQQQKHEFDDKILRLQQELNETKKGFKAASFTAKSAEKSTSNIEQTLKVKIRKLEFELDKAKKEKAPTQFKQVQKIQKDDSYYKNILFSLLAKRYANHINEHEIKTVQALKDSIQPDNHLVIDLVHKFSSTDHLKAAFEAYTFIIEEIKSVPSIGVNFWMSIEEIFENRVADYEDKAVLLCSILKAVDLDAWVMITELQDGSNRPLVLINQDEKNVIILDPNNEHDFLQYSGNFEEILKNYNEKGNKISRPLYKFNEKDYEELTQ